MQQIAEWLEKLGMSEYGQRFAENRIDFSILPDLTDQHLKDLVGIALGDRLKILRAIRELSSPVSPPPLPELQPQEAAERRQVTVMFSDLVGSTALSVRMDPEDLREVISVYQKCVAETVQLAMTCRPSARTTSADSRLSFSARRTTSSDQTAIRYINCRRAFGSQWWTSPRLGMHPAQIEYRGDFRVPDDRLAQPH